MNKKIRNIFYLMGWGILHSGGFVPNIPGVKSVPYSRAIGQNIWDIALCLTTGQKRTVHF
jgi:hypothetical protein